jgi:hypothetical protein
MAHRYSYPTLTVLLVLTFALSTIDTTAETLHEQGWRTFPKKVQVLKDSYKGNYEREVIKNDVFIFQKKVVIDKLLLTNGGDVLIVADELLLNAPIDTRVRLRMGPDYWLSPVGAQADHNRGLGQILTMWGHPSALYAFDSLYLWREAYDPKEKRFTYERAPRPEKKEATPSTVAELPQLPSAQVPIASDEQYGKSYNSTRPSDGVDAPDADVIWENVRSGNIRIIASKVQLCDQCKDAVSKILVLNRDPKRLQERSARLEAIIGTFEKFGGGWQLGRLDVPGDPFDVARSVFLQTSGLKGGRGAAGSTHFGAYGNLLGKPGGLSGKPGRGGDAGNIEVHLRTDIHEDAAELRDLFRQGAALADGGEPAQSHRQRTPGVAMLEATQNRSAFVDEVPIPDFENLRGKPGTIRVDMIDADAAIRLINAKLVEAELSGNYDLDLLLTQAASSPTLFSISPVDVLVDKV